MVDNEMKKIIGLLVMSLCMFIGGCSMNRYENQMGEISKDEMEKLSGLERRKFSNWLEERDREIQQEVQKIVKSNPQLEKLWGK
jgi:uncharacterized protein YggL (DUF469 family)